METDRRFVLLFTLFRRYLPNKETRNSAKAREDSPTSTWAEQVFSYLSGTDVLTLAKMRERESKRCRNRGKTTSVESCNRHTHTYAIVEHTHTLILTTQNQQNVLFSISLLPMKMKKKRSCWQESLKRKHRKSYLVNYPPRCTTHLTEKKKTLTRTKKK